MNHLLPVEVVDALAAISAGAVADEQESETLDFKQDAREPGETIRILLETAICLANARGGAIVLGVDDDAGGVAAFLGTSLDPAVIRKRLNDLSEPPLVVTAIEHEHEGQRLIIIGVPEGMEMHSDKKGRSSRRFGTDCQPLSISQAATLNDDRRRFDWSSEPSDLSPEDISEEALEAARTMLRRFPDERRALADATRNDLLGDLGVLRDGRLLRAGTILFAHSASIPMVYVYRETPGGEMRSEYRDAAPGIVAYRTVLANITSNSAPTAVTLPDGQQITLYDFPQLAVREALSNAMIHRDHRQPDPITIDHSPNVLSFVSPGPLVQGVTPENILHTPSKPRNALLAKVARQLGLAEELSRGVDRMYREMIKLGKQPPEITEDAPFNVRVDLTGGAPNQTVAKFVATLPDRVQDDVDTMLVLFALMRKQVVSATDLAPLLQRSTSATDAVLRSLGTPEIDMIAPYDRQGGSRWQLSARAVADLRMALDYRTVTGDEIDRKIVEFVRKNKTIDNKTIQIFFDLDVNGAAYRIKTLVRSGVLAKLGEQKRGPGIQYGAGPNFPKA
jgi:ATP-dependent DNA helicase RecG